MFNDFLALVGRVFCMAIGAIGLLVAAAEYCSEGYEVTAPYSGATPECQSIDYTPDNSLPPTFSE